MSEQTSILILNTGGTIGMMLDEKSGALKPVDFNDLFEVVPTLRLFNYQIDHYSFDPLIDSSNINPASWQSIANVIKDKYEQYDGFVILHGSDTMAFTASALSFMLQNLNKPVVLTGSQLPLGMVRTDGRENLLTAVEIAASKEDETPIVPEVCICFENQLYRGNRTHKFNAQNFEAFRSFNYPELASAGISLVFNKSAIHKPNFKRLKVYEQLDTNVAILKLYPGISQAVTNAIGAIPGLKGLVLETYGSGNAPDAPWLMDTLEKLIASDVLVLNVTQCQVGSVELGKYETSIRLRELGVISGRDMTTEAAITKLMHLFGVSESIDNVKDKLRMSLVGEMTI